jgi:hypothetical protein
MRHIKQTAIRTETSEQWIIHRRPAGSTVLPCERCGTPAKWLSIQDAALATGLTLSELCLLAERHQLHSTLTPDGHLLICTVSLGRAILKGEQNYDNT